MRFAVTTELEPFSVLTLIVSGLALVISIGTFLLNLPINVLRREQTAQMRRIGARAYGLYSYQRIYLHALDGQDMNVPMWLTEPAAIDVLRDSSMLLREALDRGIALGLISELMGEHEDSRLEFAHTTNLLSGASAERSDLKRLEGGLIRILDLCLRYDHRKTRPWIVRPFKASSRVFTKDVRRKIEKTLSDIQ